MPGGGHQETRRPPENRAGEWLHRIKLPTFRSHSGISRERPDPIFVARVKGSMLNVHVPNADSHFRPQAVLGDSQNRKFNVKFSGERSESAAMPS